MTPPNPTKYKLPLHLQSQMRSQYSDIKDFLKGFEESMPNQNIEEITNDHKAFMLYAFISVTGLHPNDVMLIQRNFPDGSTGLTYAKKNPTGNWSTWMKKNQLENEIKRLKEELRVAKEIIDNFDT